MEKENFNHQNVTVLEKDMIYYVISGAVDIFLIRLSSNSNIQYKRYFLENVSEGTGILGGEVTIEKVTYKLMAITYDTEIKSFSVQDTNISREGIFKWLKYINNKEFEIQLESISKEPLSNLIFIGQQHTLNYIQAKAYEIQQQKIWQQERYIQKKKNEAAMLNEAVDILTDNKMKAIFHQSGSTLFKTCRVVANALGMEIVEPKTFNQDYENNHKLIKNYFEKTKMKYRGIKLKGLWWEKVDGAIIAFKSNEQPVAILPSKNGKYEILDLELGKCIKLDKKSAEGLLQDAYMIYRSLPDKKIDGRDLLSFALKKISKKDIILFTFTFLGAGILGMFTPILIGLTVDWIVPQGNLNILAQMGVILSVITLTTFLFNLTRGFLMLRIEGKLDSDLQSAIWDRLLNLPLSFFKKFTSAELASRALGISKIRDIVSGPILEIMLTGIFSLFCWIVLFYYHILLALITSVMVAVCFVINYFLAKKELFFEYRINQISNKMAGMTFQLIKGAIKIQQSGAIEGAYYKWANEQAEKHKAIHSKGLITSTMEAFNGLYLPISMGIIYYLITMKPAFKLPVGQFIGFNSAYIMFTSAIFNIFSSMHTLFEVMPLYERGKTILETKPECKEDKVTIDELIGKISADHIQFKYSTEGDLILKDISLEIKPGEYVGIVGTSGSGKSTLMRLMLGFESLYQGKITYDDKDLNSIDLRDLRKKIGVVLQNGKLLTDSIYHNIVGTHLQLTMEDAWNAAKVAGIDEDIKAMPMGMHTIVMDGAGTISGGQKQRILIARAVVNKPKILFFDEATSALDNITQSKIKMSLDNLSVTRIVIAHRLSTIKNCDRIIVLDKGEIKETGSYEELMKKRGTFYKIAQRQLV